MIADFITDDIISIHAPRERSDFMPDDVQIVTPYISIHAPRERSDSDDAAFFERFK